MRPGSDFDGNDAGPSLLIAPGGIFQGGNKVAHKVRDNRGVQPFFQTFVMTGETLGDLVVLGLREIDRKRERAGIGAAPRDSLSAEATHIFFLFIHETLVGPFFLSKI